MLWQRRRKLEGRKRKMQKRKLRARVNRMIRSKKRALPVNGTYTKNIVYKEVLTL
jgi:hypothetical protein